MGSSADLPLFVCPLTFKEMNGVQPFVYISSCGCVFSQAGLKTVSGASSTPPPKDKEEAEPTNAEVVRKQLDICPQCSTKFDYSQDLIVLNPSPDEEERLRAAMEHRRLLEPKKSKKRKGAGANGDAEPPLKKKSSAVPPSTNPSISAASRALVSSLAMEEAKRKAGMSDAVKSMYGSDDKVKRKETFMTMGTFTRVCVFVFLP
jgi:hypothetical protein